MNNKTASVQARAGAVRPARRALALLAVFAVALSSGCSTVAPQDDPATRVLQSVDVALSSSGQIESLDGTAVFLNEVTGGMRSEPKSYQPSDVVNDLPVRVTTRYRTDKGSGADLADLEGHSGNVEIEVSLENLTVESENLTYDSMGQSRTSPALVGVPLSIAASVALPGTSPSAVVFDAESVRKTNGVVSADQNGGSIVQWGTLLAPPQTEATKTLRLVAYVEDFTVPDIDISVQVGIHSDLSFEGVLSSAIDTSSTSPLGMQQQAITIVVDVNDVLTRAGAAITDVRKDLSATSDTLGLRTVQRLNQSSKQLSAEMRELSAQIAALEEDLTSTTVSTSTAMNSELTQIVRAMDVMLGNTDGVPPKLYDGEGCASTLKEFAPDGTVFSTFLYLSALLEGYADVSEACQKQILNSLDKALGPEAPTAEICSAEELVSATCALFESKVTVRKSMEEFEARGAQLVESLDRTTIDDAHQLSEELNANLADIDQLLIELRQDSGRAELRDRILGEARIAQEQSERLGGLAIELGGVSGRLGVIAQKQTEIASGICALDDGTNVVDRAQLGALSAQLTGSNCEGIEVERALLPPGTPINDLPAQADAVTNAADALSGVNESSDISKLNNALLDIELIVGATPEGSDWNSISEDVESQLRSALDAASSSAESLRVKIEKVQGEQGDLGEQINSEFSQTAAAVGALVDQNLDESTAGVNLQRGKSMEEISASYEELIASLRSSASRSVAEGKVLIDGQQANLEEMRKETTSSLNERTVAALERIERSTSASTRDVDAASAQLTDSLNKVLLDLGDPKVKGSGLLGAMAASAAKAGTADFQLAEASQHAAGYANVRDQDVTGILLRGAQIRAALDKTVSLPPFYLEVPKGATSQTVYSFHLSGSAK